MNAAQYCRENHKEPILGEWDSRQNADCTPEAISYASHRKVWWMCSEGHMWQSPVKDRVMSDAGCPYCTNRKVLKGYNDLASKLPELAKEWHPTANGRLRADQVTMGSEKKVWWQCELGHEWQASILNRAGKGQACPYCSGKKAWPGYNDLATLYPELMEQWHPTLNADLDPQKLRPASRKRAWWMCSEGHVWESYIFNRTASTKPGCPICTGNQKTSKQVEWLAKAIEKEKMLERSGRVKREKAV